MRMVPCKGLGDKGEAKWIVNDLHEELKAWGRPGGPGSSLMLKTDGENPIVAVREALAKKHGGIVTPEQPPKGEHAANGLVEEAGRTIRDMVRVLKLQLEANLNHRLSVSHPIMKWLTRWAAMLLSRFRVSSENKTAYEKQTGRRCKQEVVPFAEWMGFRRLDDDGAGKSKLS